jgi:hypothetical protein
MAAPIQNHYFIPTEILAQMQAQIAYLQALVNGLN